MGKICYGIVTFIVVFSFIIDESLASQRISAKSNKEKWFSHKKVLFNFHVLQNVMNMRTEHEDVFRNFYHSSD